jgi:hypothetical protein
LLNPFGVSGFDEMPNKSIEKYCAKGGHFACFHSNLCATSGLADKKPDELYRVGIGGSQTAQALLAVVNSLDGENLQALLNPQLLKLAVDEGNALKPFLETLAMGKVGFQTKNKGLSSAKRPRTEDTKKHTEDTRDVIGETQLVYSFAHEMRLRPTSEFHKVFRTTDPMSELF